MSELKQILGENLGYIKPLDYDRTIKTMRCPLTNRIERLNDATDEDARRWVRNNVERLGESTALWHPAYVAARKEFLESNNQQEGDL